MYVCLNLDFDIIMTIDKNDFLPYLNKGYVWKYTHINIQYNKDYVFLHVTKLNIVKNVPILKPTS